jgi:endogenous inhibitor of DNA gyrase (YacG/DUF329 family)
MTIRIYPICRKASTAAPYAPFCSKRCADVDLQRWFAGVYAVPAVEQDDEGPEDESAGG